MVEGKSTPDTYPRKRNPWIRLQFYNSLKKLPPLIPILSLSISKSQGTLTSVWRYLGACAVTIILPFRPSLSLGLSLDCLPISNSIDTFHINIPENVWIRPRQERPAYFRRRRSIHEDERGKAPGWGKLPYIHVSPCRNPPEITLGCASGAVVAR